MNPAYQEIWGRPTQALLENYDEWARGIHPDDLENASESFRSILKSGGGESREYRVMRPDGTVRWVSDRGFPVYGDDGEVLRIVGIAEDITSQKNAEQKLRASEEKFSMAFHSSPDAITISRVSDGRILEVNEGFIRGSGYRRDEVIGKSDIDLGLWADPGERERWAKALGEDNRLSNCEFQYRTKSGDVRDGLLSGELIQIGEEKCFIGTIRDITERKRTEEELKKAHQTFLTVLDGIDATIHVADMDTYEILFMNQYMIDHFNGDYTGGICFDAFRGYDRPCDHCTNDQILDAEGQPLGVFTWETKNPKSNRWYMNYDRAIRWVDGRIVRLQIATDITPLKDLEQERLQTEMQLRQAQKMESVGRLAGGVAHDFNNMLGVIIGRAELAMEQVGPTVPIYSDLKEIYNAARRSAELTRQLLAFARKQTILPRVLDLNMTVAGMLRMLRRMIGEGIELTWKPGANLWPVKIDPAQIDQILANLCVNAGDAIAGTGKIAIETTNVELAPADCVGYEGLVSGKYVMLEINDDGCGMDKETLENIFEPFFTTKGVGEGTGLGLSTVYGIVKQNDGFIYAASRPEEGTSFKVYLQRSLEVVESNEEAAGKTIKKGIETVLLVEDEPSFLHLGKTVLERFGYVILAAGKPSDAIAMAKSSAGRIHLLITDVVMPEMNGLELRNRIEEIEPGIKVLFMSGYASDAAIGRGVLEEGMHFLEKPFSVRSLSSKVREILDEES